MPDPTELLPPPPKKKSNAVAEDNLLPPPPKKKSLNGVELSNGGSLTPSPSPSQLNGNSNAPSQDTIPSVDISDPNPNAESPLTTLGGNIGAPNTVKAGVDIQPYNGKGFYTDQILPVANQQPTGDIASLPNVPHAEDVKKKQAAIRNTNTAVDNFVAKKVAQKGGDAAYHKQQALSMLNNDELVVAKDDNGDLTLKRSAPEPIDVGGGQGLNDIVNAGRKVVFSLWHGIKEAQNANIENGMFANMTQDERASYLDLKRSNPSIGKTYPDVAEEQPTGVGKALNFVGEQVPVLAKAGIAATAVAEGVATANPAMVGAGASEFGSFIGLANDLANGGYKNNYERTYYNITDQKAKENMQKSGLTDDEIAQVFKDKGTAAYLTDADRKEATDAAHGAGLVGEASQLVVGGVLSKSLAPVAEGFASALKKVALKEAPRMAATSAGSSLIDAAGRKIAGSKENVGDNLKEALDAGISGYGVGAVFGLPHLLGAAYATLKNPDSVPTYVVPQAKNLVASVAPSERVTFFDEAVKDGLLTPEESTRMSAQVGEFAGAKKTVDNLPISEAKKAAITEKIIQNNKLKDEKTELEQHGDAFSQRIGEIDKELSGNESEIAKMYAAPDVFSVAKDEVTGEPADNTPSYTIRVGADGETKPATRAEAKKAIETAGADTFININNDPELQKLLNEKGSGVKNTDAGESLPTTISAETMQAGKQPLSFVGKQNDVLVKDRNFFSEQQEKDYHSLISEGKSEEADKMIVDRKQELKTQSDANTNSHIAAKEGEAQTEVANGQSAKSSDENTGAERNPSPTGTEADTGGVVSKPSEKEVVAEGNADKGGKEADPLKDVESTAKALDELPKEEQDMHYPKKARDIQGIPLPPLDNLNYRTNDAKSISEAYHKAKADGSNPELVKAVEDALTPKQQSATPTQSIQDEDFLAKGGNKAVDEKGEPLTVYHGTDFEFENFDVGKAKKWGKFGVWFADDKPSVEAFGGKVKEAHVSIKNPKVISWEDWNKIRDEHAKDDEWFANWKKELQSQGHDGLKIEGSTEKVGRHEVVNPTTYAVFSNEQIRSAKTETPTSQLPPKANEAVGSEAKPEKQSVGSEKKGEPLKDINDVEIKVGDTVKTTQPSGGVLSPAESETGIAEKTTDAFGNDTLQIRYRKKGQDFDSLILLDGKTNEVVKPASENVKASVPKTEESGTQLTPSEPINPITGTKDISSLKTESNGKDNKADEAQRRKEGLLNSEQKTGVDNNAAPVSETVPEKIGDAIKQLASKVREGKISKLGGFKTSTGFDAVWDASLEVVAKALEATGDIANAIEAGLKHIRESDWYKNLTDKKDFEEKYTSHLESEFGVKEPPKPPIADEGGERGDATSIKNGTTRLRREQFALNDEVPAMKKEFGDTWEEAKRKIEKGYNPQDLVDELYAKPRPVSDVENAVLLHHQNTNEIKLIDLNDQINEAAEKGDAQSVVEFRAAKARVLDELQRIYDVNKRVGTENARGLASRRMMVDRKYSLANMVAEKRATENEGKPLSEEQQNEVEALHKKIQETQKAFDDYMEQADTEIKNLQEKLLGKKINKKTAAQKLRDWADRLEERAKGHTFAVPVPITAKMIANAMRLVATGLEKGGDLLELIKEAVAKTKADNPDIDEKQLRKQLSSEALNSGIVEKPVVGGKDYSVLLRGGKLDRTALKLKANAERAKNEFDIALTKAEQAKRSRFQKIQDTFVKWERGFKLSNPITMGKLAMAGLTRLTTTPLEDVVGGAYSLVLPKLAKGAIGEGGGLHVKEIADAYKYGLIEGMKDAYTLLRKGKHGKSDVDVVFGSKGELPPEAIDFFGQLHSATKAPIKRFAFERSLTRRLRRNLANGVDVSDPMVQTEILIGAYKDANRAIFMQDNLVAKGYQNFVEHFDRVDPKTGKAPYKFVGTAMKWMIPFVKVPTNIAAEIGTHTYGVPVGAAKLLHAAFTTGIENLPADEKDIIMRSLKKGTLGLAAMALGYFNPQTFGGFYQSGEKRKDDDAEAFGLKLGEVKVPAWFVEAPIFQVMQLGATIRRVKDAKVKGEEKGIEEGVWAGALGLVDRVPMIDQPIRIAKIFGSSRDRNYYFDQLAKSTVDPALIDYLARATDPADKGSFMGKALAPENKRKATTMGQTIKSGIPFLRETLPLKGSENKSGW